MYKRAPLEKRLRLRGKIYEFWGYDYAGKRYFVSTHQSDKKAAIEAARKIERDRAVPSTNQASDSTPQNCTLAEAFAELAAYDKRVKSAANTVAFHEDRGAHLVRLLGADFCFDGNTERELRALNEYTDMRLAEKADRHTIQKEHRVLRHALRLMKDIGRYPGEPKKLTIDGFRRARAFYTPGSRWLEKPEWIEELLAQTSSNPDKHRVDRRDDVLAYVNLGVRRRELNAILPEHVDLRAGTVHVAGSKTEGSKRDLPLNDAMHDLFKRRLRNAQPGRPLFVDWGSGNRDLRANWARARAALLERARGRAREELERQLPDGLTFNDLRRTFCSLMRNAGVSFEDCAELLGHEDIAMVRLVYGKTASDAGRRAVARLPALRLPEELPRSAPQIDRPKRASKSSSRPVKSTRRRRETP